jgi:hypothetical protein
MGNSRGFPTSHHTQDSETFCKSYDIFIFSFQIHVGMLLAIAIATESAQNSPKQPKTAKFCQKLPKDD